MFNPNELHYAKGAPTNDTLLLTRAATEAVERVYQAGYRYSKAEVLLLDLRQPGEFTDDLFAVTQPVASGRLMTALDEINDRYGRGTVHAGSVPPHPRLGDAPGNYEPILYDSGRPALDRLCALIGIPIPPNRASYHEELS